MDWGIGPVGLGGGEAMFVDDVSAGGVAGFEGCDLASLVVGDCRWVLGESSIGFLRERKSELEDGGKGEAGGTVSMKFGVVEMKRSREGRRNVGGRAA